MSSETDNKYLYTANSSVGDTTWGPVVPNCLCLSTDKAGNPIQKTNKYGFKTPPDNYEGNPPCNGHPAPGCPVDRWVTNLSTTDNKVNPAKYDGSKVIPPSGGIQACTNVCDEDFDKLNICVPADWDRTQGKPTECIKTVVKPDKNGRLPSGYNTWCPEGYKPGTYLNNNNVVPMTNPYHNSQYCINKRKTNPSTKPPYTGPPFGKNPGISKGTIIAIVSGSVALIGGIVTAILLSKKKTLVYKSLDR